MNKYWPAAIFIIFALLLLGILFYYAPSWGLMDDWQNLTYAESIWHSPQPLASLYSAIKAQLNINQEYYRPIYTIWTIFAYHFARSSPIALYFCIYLLNFCSLILWGVFLHRSLNTHKNTALTDIFIFPLSFFIFTPFWNIFMYISLQEKFVIFFGIISFIFLAKALDNKKIPPLILSMLAAVCALLSKPTGIYLIIALAVFYFFILVFLRQRNAVTIGGLLSCIVIFSLYYIMTVKFQCKGYTAGYGKNMSLSGLSVNLAAAPAVVKALFFSGCMYLLYIFFKLASGKTNIKAPFLLVPLGFTVYILILLPWGIHNYHLSVAAPYLLGMTFPVYNYCCRKSASLKAAINILLLSIISFFLIYAIIPRISKMSDIKKAINFMIDFKGEKEGAIYYFPPPYSESAIAIENFTGEKVNFLNNGILDNDMLQNNTGNYLIYRDEGTGIILKNVKIDKEIYRNNTWRIYSLAAKDAYQSGFKPAFPENLFGRLKSYLLKK